MPLNQYLQPTNIIIVSDKISPNQLEQGKYYNDLQLAHREAPSNSIILNYTNELVTLGLGGVGGFPKRVDVVAIDMIPKIWAGLISQGGTNAPDLVETYENTFGCHPVFTRQDVGNYRVTFPKNAPAHFVILGGVAILSGIPNEKVGYFGQSPASDETAYLGAYFQTFNNSNVLADDILTSTYFVVRGYYHYGT